jgi:predicted glycosyltransferase
MKDWCRVYDTELEHRAEIVKSILIENQIMAVVVNKSDSMYKVFEKYELHVAPENVLKALKIIEDDISFK